MDMTARYFKLFQLKDTSYGTLWWVANIIWQQNEKFVLKRGEEENSHPGVSIRGEQVSEYVPMLLGTSKYHSPSKAIRMSLDDTQNKNVYFGSLEPVNAGFLMFIKGYLSENSAKKCLSDSDKKRLKAFLDWRLTWK